MPKKRSTATSPLASFPTSCKAAFGPVLGEHGFAPLECDISSTTARQVFASGARYVEVSANLEPRDAPHYCAVTLGEGNRSWPERDWNAVPLWRMIADIEPAHVPADRDPYGIAGTPEVEPVLGRMAADLREYGGDFLRGDLGRFYRLRAEQTRAREPYTIWSPDRSGQHRPRPDPVSAELKARFGKADGSAADA
jgi:hypothetical protein